MLELKGVSKKYQEHEGEVLTSVSLEIEDGEFFGIAGTLPAF